MNQPVNQQPATVTPTLAHVIRTGWKKLALADQTDADEMLAALKEVLEELEKLEAAGSARE